MTVTINGTTGYTGPIGAIGDLSTTGNTTLGDASGDTLTINGSTTTFTQGTANGVAYLNGSKALTTGSALVFDGTNLGVGVTPSAWYSTWKALEVGNGAVATAGTPDMRLYCNAYKNASAADTYKGTGQASYYIQNNGAHSWGIAGSGTAGNPITFTQAMTLDTSGNLLLGTTSVVTLAHGGTNKIINVYNPDTTSNAQSHILLLSNASAQTDSSIGSISWGLPNASATNKGVALIAAVTGSSSTSANPSAYMNFYTRNTSDAAWVERMRIDAVGRRTNPYQTAFRATNGSASISNTDIIFTATDYNVGSGYNTSTGVFTAPVAGMYLFYLTALYTNNGSSPTWKVSWYKNGAFDAVAGEWQTTLTTYNTAFNSTIIISLAVNDTVKLVNVATPSVHISGVQTKFGGYLLG